MMYIPSEYQIKLQQEVWPWLIYNPKTEFFELKSEAPKDIQNKYIKLQNYLQKHQYIFE